MSSPIQPIITHNVGSVDVRIDVERDYLKLVGFKLALEKIAELGREQWSFSGEDAADLAQHALTIFGGEDDGTDD